MNAFLMNTLIILLCSLPAVQFCVTAFPIYAKDTQANVMFGNQIRYLEFFRYFFDHNVFIILMLCISALTILFLFLFPNNKAAGIEAQLDRLAKSTNTSLKDYADDLK
jgi:C4-dicarboxylate transporter